MALWRVQGTRDSLCIPPQASKPKKKHFLFLSQIQKWVFSLFRDAANFLAIPQVQRFLNWGTAMPQPENLWPCPLKEQGEGSNVTPRITLLPGVCVCVCQELRLPYLSKCTLASGVGSPADASTGNRCLPKPQKTEQRL